MTKRLIMTTGLPASGKTTWALREKERLEKQLIPTEIVCKDDIRDALVKTGWVWSPKNEATVIKIRNGSIRGAFARGIHVVIVADTNFGKHEVALRGIAQSCKASFEIQDFTHVPLDTCIQRDKDRQKSVGVAVINNMYQKYVAKPEPLQTYVPDLNKPIALICDLDGTLAIHKGRSPYDYAKCDTDELNEVVANIVTMHRRLGGFTVLYVSGREDSAKDKTIAWLEKHNLWHPNTHLFMRASGDKRPDNIMKQEIFDKEIRGSYNVRFVLDDRNKVVKMWRELGLTCLQVAEGDF